MTSFRAPRNLREYVQVLRSERELVEIDVEVDARLELAEIHRRVIAANGPGLLFRRVKGRAFPAVTNLFGSTKRIELAFGPDPGALLRSVVELVERLVPPTWGGLWQSRRVLARLLRVGTRRVSRAPVLAFEETPRLTALPATTSWAEDGGPFLTLPLVYTEHPLNRSSNLGIYRMQIFDDSHAGMHWQIAKGGGFHYAVAEERSRPLPVSVFLGGPPAAMVAALAPLPENAPEILVASLLLQDRFPRVERADLPHALFSEAEFALIGEVPAHERRPEGPFGDHYGSYSLRHDYPVFHCRRIFRRADAIFPATVVGKPRQEDFYLGDFLQELLKPVFPLVMPSVHDLWSYGETGYHSLAAAIVRERFRREAMVSAFRILGEGQLALTKFLLVTDGRIDLKDFRAVLSHVLARTRFETDLFVFSQLSMDTLDYTGPRVNEGSKGVLLGLGEPVRELPTEFSGALPAEFPFAQPFCAGCLVVEGPEFSKEPEAAARLSRVPAAASWPLLVLTDEGRRAAKSSINFLWTTFTRFNPASDLHARNIHVEHHHLVHTAPLVIDARRKPSYPKELFCDPDTAALVSRRWKEYFPGDVPMGNSDLAHLDG